jgi:hypothetical protein
VLHAVLKRAEALEPAIRAPVACDALGEAPNYKKVPPRGRLEIPPNGRSLGIR